MEFQNFDAKELVAAAKAWLEYIETEDCVETENIRQFHALCLPACRRRLAITKRGHFCLVPKHTEPGDLVCIPQGSKVPFIFRKVRDGLVDMEDSAGHICKSIGESYVHGAMHGEAMTWDELEAARIMLI